MIYSLALACVVDRSECRWSHADPFPDREACLAQAAALEAEARRLAMLLIAQHGKSARWFTFCMPLEDLRSIVPGAYPDVAAEVEA